MRKCINTGIDSFSNVCPFWANLKKFKVPHTAFSLNPSFLIPTFCPKWTLIAYNHGTMELYYVMIPLCSTKCNGSKEFDAIEDMFYMQLEDELFGKDWLQCSVTHILIQSTNG
jgi:hypothetical protein